METMRTERLVVRPFTADDLDAYVAYRTDPGVVQWMTSAIAPSRDELSARIDRMVEIGRPVPGEWFGHAIELDGEVLGDVSTFVRDGGGIAEIGYALRSTARGNGYAQEAAGALVDHLIANHGVHRVEASLAPDNVASMRVLEAIGMRFEVLARDAFCFDGVWEDDLRYAMTAADRVAWRSRPRHVPGTVELVEITPDEAYLWGRLATHHSQESFVSPMALTWRDALFPESFEDVVAVPWMRGVLADGERVAFVMLSRTHGRSEGQYLWRLLVDRMHQRRGIGARVIELVVDGLRADGVPRLFTSIVHGPGSPGPFYARLGFTPTGRDVDGETELVLEL